MKTAYYTVDGEIVGESTNGVRLDYLTDVLGSVTAKVDQAASVVSSARYKPYGEVLAGSAYIFGWVGTLGYRTSQGGQYIRARHYLVTLGVWTSVDRYWTRERAYLYSRQNPILRVDPSGLLCQDKSCCCCADSIKITPGKTYHDETYDYGLGIDDYILKHFLGQELTVTPSWSKQSTDPAPKTMPPCQFIWKEWWYYDDKDNTDPGDPVIPPAKGENGSFDHNVQWDQWQKCNRDLCQGNSCNIKDAPGVRVDEFLKHGQTAHGVCVKLALTSSCKSGCAKQDVVTYWSIRIVLNSHVGSKATWSIFKVVEHDNIEICKARAHGKTKW